MADEDKEKAEKVAAAKKKVGNTETSLQYGRSSDGLADEMSIV